MTPTLTSLTDDQKCALLAEAQGWINTPRDGEVATWSHPGQRLPGGRDFISEMGLPDPLHDLNAAITLCDMLADNGWKMHFHKGTSETWEVEMYREADSHFVIFGPLATAISNCALLALNLATK